MLALFVHDAASAFSFIPREHRMSDATTTTTCNNLLTSCWLAHPPSNHRKTNQPISLQTTCMVSGVFSQGPASRSFFTPPRWNTHLSSYLQPTVFQTSNLRSICNPISIHPCAMPFLVALHTYPDHTTVPHFHTMLKRMQLPHDGKSER